MKSQSIASAARSLAAARQLLNTASADEAAAAAACPTGLSEDEARLAIEARRASARAEAS